MKIKVKLNYMICMKRICKYVNFKKKDKNKIMNMNMIFINQSIKRTRTNKQHNDTTTTHD